MQYLRCTTYDIVGRTYDVVTYDIQEYRRYDVTYDIVGVTYDVVVADLRYRRWPTISYVARIQMAWSAATYCVCWLQDTAPRLCAKCGALRRMFNEVSSRSSMNWRMGNHVSEKRFCIFKLIKLRLRGVSRTVNWDDPIISMCQCEATIEFTACKTKGHIKTFQRYFDSLSQQGFRLLLITSIEVDNLI